MIENTCETSTFVKESWVSVSFEILNKYDLSKSFYFQQQQFKEYSLINSVMLIQWPESEKIEAKMSHLYFHWGVYECAFNSGIILSDSLLLF